MTVPQQLGLPFQHRTGYDPAAFLPDACNAAARAWLGVPWPGGRLIVWGAPGCGKTHLLHMWRAQLGAGLLAGPVLAALPDLSGWTGLAVDDADAAPERPLLHLLNAAAEAGLPVLLSGRSAPSRWPTRLPDLASRLRAMTAVALEQPGDGMLRTLFASLLAARQLAVAAPVQEWLLLRLPREAAALREAAETLDRLALAAGRRVTQTIAAQALELQAPLTVPEQDPPDEQDQPAAASA